MMTYYFYTKMLLLFMLQGERREYHSLTPLMYGLYGQTLALVFNFLSLVLSTAATIPILFSFCFYTIFLISVNST